MPKKLRFFFCFLIYSCVSVKPTKLKQNAIDEIPLDKTSLFLESLRQRAQQNSKEPVPGDLKSFFIRFGEDLKLEDVTLIDSIKNALPEKAEPAKWVNPSSEKKKFALINLPRCPAKNIWDRSQKALKFRRNQQRDLFYKEQENVFSLFVASECSAKHFNMSEESYEDYYFDQLLWLARLEWEYGKLDEAEEHASDILDLATQKKSKTAFLEASRILVSRIGWEKTPQHAINTLKKLVKKYEEVSQTPFEEFWFFIQFQNAFLHLAEGKTKLGKDVLSQIEKQTESSSTSQNAKIQYWVEQQKLGVYTPFDYYHALSKIKFDHQGKLSTHSLERLKKEKDQEQSNQISFGNVRALKILVALIYSLSPVTENDFKETLQQSKRPLGKMVKKYIQSSYPDLVDNLPGLNPDEHLEQVKQYVQILAHTKDKAFQIKFLIDLFNSTSTDVKTRLATNPAIHASLFPRPYEEYYEKASQLCKVDKSLLLSISRQESLFDPTALSIAGAQGIMQMLPSTLELLSREGSLPYKMTPKMLKEPEHNIVAGACYLNKLLKHYDNNFIYVIAAYNAGEKMVDKWVENRFKKLKNKSLVIEIIPYGETQSYVKAVLRNFVNYRYRSSSPSLQEKEEKS